MGRSLAAVAFLVVWRCCGTADAVERAAARPAQCQDGLVLPVWRPQENLTSWDRVSRGTLYLAALIYLFLGVSIVSDRFMGAIEVITSQEREVTVREKGTPPVERKIKVRVWNETVANLTLMALGSSAPEILLSVIEIAAKNFAAGDLGPGTIVGSAAYNLFVIIALCAYVIPDGQVRRIKHLGVFFVTAFWSVFAYVWLYVILAVTSEGVVECWEAFLTFMFFPATVLTAYLVDRKLKVRFKRFRLHRKRIIVAAESGDVDVDVDDDVDAAEEERFEDAVPEESGVADPHRFAIILRDLKRRNSGATPQELERLAVEELAKHTRKSKAFYRLQTSKHITGGVAQTGHPRKERVRCETVAVPLRGGSSRVYFDPDYYSVLENVGEFDVTVAREGADLSPTVTVFYATEDGTAVAGSDYEGVSGTIVFHAGETRKTITLRVIDDDIFEEDEHFYLHLTKAVVCTAAGNAGRAKQHVVVLGDSATATIVILDDDHCGVFAFAVESTQVSENVGVCRLEVVRGSGARGRVSVGYTMHENTAKHERHFMERSGTLIFENNETRKEIDIEIVDENCYEKNVSFFVRLESAQEIGVTNERRHGDQVNDVCDDICDEEKIALKGKPKLGKITKVEVIIRESDEFKNTVNKLVEQEGQAVGFSSWSEQFGNAFRVKIDEDGTDQNTERTWCDYFVHFITFAWKLLFAFVPPANIYSGYLCFVVSVIFIGLLTAIIGDVASHFGCSVGLKDSVTAVTFVALGTSVPDTFASKLAAIQDSTADNSVGNVTGSNAVNVFLGIGIAWSVASFYHKWHNRQFYVNVGNLAFCVTLYCVEAGIAIAILLMRRSKLIGGELGGPKLFKYLTSLTFFLLWVFYITMTSLEAYGVIKGF